MSSTNRSSLRNAHISDYYITPKEDIKLFLQAFSEVKPLAWKKRLILDPCAGGDINNGMSYPDAIQEYHKVDCICTIDIREDSKASQIADYLTYKINYTPDIIITNPPFNIALDIIKKALNDVAVGGWVIMLLRLNFFGSKQRKSFWDEFMPSYCFVHHKRIGFTKNGGTDSIEYMHCCWQKGNNPRSCQLIVI